MSLRCLDYIKNKAKTSEHSKEFLKHLNLSCLESIMYGRCEFEKSYLTLENIYFNILCIKIQFQEIKNLGIILI